MHSYALRTSEHWLQNCSSVFIFLHFLSRGKMLRVVVLCVYTTGKYNSARNAERTARTDRTKQWHMPCGHMRDESGRGTAFSVTHSVPAHPFTQVWYRCSMHVPRGAMSLMCWDLRGCPPILIIKWEPLHSSIVMVM